VEQSSSYGNGSIGIGVDRFVVISGCSGGGKSTLIAEFGRRGYAIVEEPGRRIVKEELANGGSALFIGSIRSAVTP
jgi:predicted ATPase